jgi:midasin (ATPase involved in ribosome maturation)
MMDDLIFSYKPVDLKYIVGPLREEFETLFRSYFSVQKNVQFLEYIAVSLCVTFNFLLMVVFWAVTSVIWAYR